MTADAGWAEPGTIAAATPDAARGLRRGALANVVGRGASAVLWLLVTPLVLSRLGTERFAVWSLFFVLGGYAASLDLGMSNGIARYVALLAARGDRSQLLLVFRRSLAVSAGLGLVWLLACAFLRGPLIGAFHVPSAIAPEVSRSLVVFAASLFVFSLTQVVNSALAGFQRLDLANVCFLSGLTLHTAVLVVVLSLGAGLIGTAFAAISGHALSGLLATRFLRRELRRVADAGPSTPVTWRELLHFGGAVQASAACAVGQLQAGKVLLGVLGRLVWVTQFELGFRVANAVWSLPVLIHGAVIPAAAHASVGRAHDGVRDVYAWACRWVFAFAGLVLAGLWLLAAPALVLWLGPGHGDSIAATRGLAIAFALATLGGPATAVARGGGWPLLETGHFAVALLFNIALGAWLVPRLGVPGATLAMAGSYGLASVWIVAMLHRRLHVATLRWLGGVVLPRLLWPAAAAALVAAVWRTGEPAGRAQALVTIAGHGAAFVVLALALSWHTGDARAVLERVRARWARGSRP